MATPQVTTGADALSHVADAFRLKGTLSDKGQLNLGGTAGNDFIRVSGRMHANGRVINGTWDGVIDRKKSNGRVQLKR